MWHIKGFSSQRYDGPVAKLSPTAKSDLWPATSSFFERKASTYPEDIRYTCCFLSRLPCLGTNLTFLVTEIVLQQAYDPAH